MLLNVTTFFALQRQPSVRQAALEQSADTNAVPDRSVQSMRVQFSGSVQRSSLNKFHVCAQTFLFEM
jgi:hypothetical protein